MAAELIQHPETPQTFIHDLESAFWVLIWVVVSYMPTNMDAGKRSNFLKDIMSPKVYDKSSSGLEKVDFLWRREVPTVPGVENIGFLLSELIKLFAFRYPVVETTTPPDAKFASVMEAMDAEAADINMDTADDADNAGDKDPNEDPKEESNAKEDKLNAVYRRGLENHLGVIALFAAILRRNGWPQSDKADPQEMVLSRDEKCGMLAGTAKSRSVAEVFVQPS
jgi:hypothetical protein